MNRLPPRTSLLITCRSALVFVAYPTILFAVTHVLSSELHADVVTWSTIAGGNGHAYEFVNAFLWWGEAKEAALARTPPPGFGGGTLVTIDSSAENAFVTQLIPESLGSWLGFTDTLVEGEWRWIDGTPGVWQDPMYFSSPLQTTYVNWATGEPNNFEGDEDFGILRSDSFWNDGQGPMSGGKGSYIVEYRPVPEIEPNSVGSVLALMLASLGLLERRRLKAA